MAKSPATKNPAAEVKSTAIANVGASNKGELIPAESFALISDKDAMEAMSYNLAGEQISEFDLDRIRVPAAGGTAFQVAGLDGIQNVETFRGVILSVSVRRAYWEDPNPTGSPPDCSSTDGFTGHGNPGGECASCPFNEFGSAINAQGKEGRGKRCRESRTILMIRESDRLPVAVIAPAGSIKNAKQYLMRLPVPMFMAVTEIKATPDKNGDGIKYSKVDFRYVGHLGPDAGKALKAFAQVIKAAIIAKAPMQSDFTSHNGEDDAGVIDAIPPDPAAAGASA